ncbi:MAG TPA: ABC transporter permease [Vicinamibacterales bacterium]|nr:ABC transporter permease [Vicinamibacterales bacterium]
MDFRNRFPLRLGRPSVDEEVDAELDFHLAMRRRELRANGMDEAAAHRAALDKFGDVKRARRECRAISHQREQRMRVAQYLSELRQDAAFAVRQLIASRGFSFVAIATLALGIGATTAIFSTVHAVVLRPLPVPNADRLVQVYEVWRDQGRGNMSAGNFVDVAAEQQAFTAMAASTAVSMTLARDEGAERVVGVRASAGFFDVWGVAPELGRVFSAAEDEPGRDQVVVLSHRFWTRQFGADKGILGRSITLDARPYTIIGVMPASFDFTADAEALWIPIAFTPERKAMHDEHYLTVYARMKDGQSIAQVTQQLATIAAGLHQKFPKDNAERELSAAPVIEAIVGDYGQRLIVLLGAVGLVLLIACGNVSNLLLARGTARARELAVRSALGAGQGRLVRQLFTESLVLSLVAAMAGIALARLLIGLLMAHGPSGVPRLEQTHLDATALSVAVLLGIGSSIMFGLVPAWRASRTDINSTLKEAVRGAGARGARDLVRSSLIAAEVALALVLLVGAGLLIRSAVETQRVPTGFNPKGVFSGRFSLPAAKYGSPAAILQATQAIEAQVAGVPGVKHAAVASNVPGVGTFSNGLVPEGEAQESRNVRQSMARFVSPGYFEVMGLPIVRGRGFNDTDRTGSQLVMVVNQTLAQRLWPNQDPIGRRLNGSAPPGVKTVIGVVGDVRWRGPAGAVDPEFYQPLAQLDAMAWEWTRRSLFVVARTDGDAAALGPSVRRAMVTVDPGVPLFAVRTMEERMSLTLETARFNTLLLALLGGVGLLLAAVGIYGVISYFVTQRTTEIGIRLALGASGGNVVRLIVRQAAVPVAVGVVIGAFGAAFAARALASQLVNVTPGDPLTFGAVAGLLTIVAMLAAVIPARRAAALDPTRALQA